MALTDIKVRTVKTSDKPFKLTVVKGCTCWLTPMGQNTGVFNIVLVAHRRCWR